ncbi:hypothetical protein BASA61_008675 [Batrachochytrium salamandrivorans]|nr:hypothetical protein BASA61_008675 [Batrachochytrium salamandrivorans]
MMKTMKKTMMKTIMKTMMNSMMKATMNPEAPLNMLNLIFAGAVVGGDAGDALVEYLDSTRHSGLGDEEYANVEPSLKEAKDKLAADVSDNLQQVTDALSAIGENTGSAKQEMETIHASFGHVL